MLNMWIGQGRLGSDVELRQTQCGTDVARVSLAVDRDYKNEAGERATDWITVVAFGQTAKFFAEHFHKGDMATVIGRITVSKWVTDDGENRYSTEVKADKIYFAQAKTQTQAAPTYMPDAYTAPQWEEITDDDDLPFA